MDENTRENSPDVDEQYNETFTKYLTTIGPITILIAALLSMLPGLYIFIRYDVIPPWQTLLNAWASVASVYGVFYIVEPVSYFAVLGIAGTYMSFLSGNIGSMRLPAAALAQEVLGVEPGSKKGELVATIAIAGSIVTNIFIITMIALAGQVILSKLPLYITDSFKYILTSLFGGLIVFFAVKSVKSLFIALPLSYLLLGVLKVKQAWLVILLCVFITITVNVIIYKKRASGDR